MRRLMAGAVVAMVLVGATTASAGGDVSRYRKVSGSDVQRIVVKRCGAEDSWSTVHLVDFGGDRAVLKCNRGGY